MTNPDLDSVSTLRRRKSDTQRLESWKAIANYLNRSVRTVRRWESTESLPVHRLQHQKGYSVFAYAAELDAWRSGHQPTGNDDSPLVKATTLPRRWNGRLAFCAVVVAVVIGSTAHYWFDHRESPYADFTADHAGYWPASVAKVLVSPAFSAWSDGRVADAHSESRRLERQLPDLPDDIRILATDYLVELAVTLGRLEDARQLARTVSDKDARSAMDARIAFAYGDMSQVKNVLTSSVGLQASAAERSVVFDGMQALMQDQPGAAQKLLLPAAFNFTLQDQGYYFVALDLLARSHAIQGEVEEAISILERTMGDLDAAAHNRAGLFWIMCQRRLASLYRQAGRHYEADSLEMRLRSMLKLADPDFPLAVSLNT